MTNSLICFEETGECCARSAERLVAVRALRTLTAAWALLLAGSALAQAPVAGSWKYSYADQQYGRYKATFTVRTGPAGAGSVKVAATDADGGPNSTTIAITIGAR